HNVSGLAGGARSILGGEFLGALHEGRFMDERVNIGFLDAATIFGTDFNCRFPGDHQFPAVPWEVVVDPCFHSLEEGGFTMVTPSHDEGHSLWDAHTSY